MYAGSSGWDLEVCSQQRRICCWTVNFTLNIVLLHLWYLETFFIFSYWTPGFLSYCWPTSCPRILPAFVLPSCTSPASAPHHQALPPGIFPLLLYGVILSNIKYFSLYPVKSSATYLFSFASFMILSWYLFTIYSISICPMSYLKLHQCIILLF